MKPHGKCSVCGEEFVTRADEERHWCDKSEEYAAKPIREAPKMNAASGGGCQGVGESAPAGYHRGCPRAPEFEVTSKGGRKTLLCPRCKSMEEKWAKDDGEPFNVRKL